MSVLVASLGCTLILVLFGFREADRIRRTHGSCAQLDLASFAAARLLSWAIVMSVVALALLPAASGADTRLLIIAGDVVLGSAVFVIRRANRARVHVPRSADQPLAARADSRLP
jgi:uncharacterized sodium:solute symporter family permease YidK